MTPFNPLKVNNASVAKTCVSALLGLAVLSASPVNAQVNPLTIDAGAVFFESQPETTLDIQGVPAGFFGAISGLPSDPIPVGSPLSLGIQGIPTRPLGLPGSNLNLTSDVVCWVDIFAVKIKHCVRDRIAVPDPFPLSNTDTIIEITDDLTLNNIGDTETVEVEIVSLSLQSATPLEVTYGGGQAASFFDVFLRLDPSSTQRRGSIIATREGENFGTFDSVLPLAFEMEFINTNPNGPRAMGTIIDDLDLVADDVAFNVVANIPESSSPLALLGLVALGVGASLLRKR